LRVSPSCCNAPLRLELPASLDCQGRQPQPVATYRVLPLGPSWRPRCIALHALNAAQPTAVRATRSHPQPAASPLLALGAVPAVEGTQPADGVRRIQDKHRFRKAHRWIQILRSSAPCFRHAAVALGDGAARTQRAAVRAADHAMDAASEPRRRVHRAHHLHQLACEPSFASSGLQARKRRNFSDLCPAFTTASAVRSALQLGRQNATMARPESPGVARTGLITCDSCPASPHLPPAGCRLATGATIAICSRRSRRRLQAGCLPLPVCAQSGRRRHYRPSVAATCRGKAVDWAVCELHGGGDKLILGKGDTLSCLLSLGPPLWRAAAAGLCQRGEHRATLLQVRSHHHLASLPHAAELSAAAVAATVPVQKMAVNVRSRLAARA
jgi:hypothetical protein